MSALDEATNTYRPAAYLIGQLGKNFTNGYDKLITGKELLDLALKVIGEAQYRVGGLFAFLEAKNDEKVLSFYAKNGFRRFDAAEIKTSRNKAHDLIQMFRNL